MSLRGGIVTLALLVACATPVFAQGYQTNFDDSTGWTFAGGANGVVWGVDGTPSSVTGGAYQSASKSLNYNNATNYNSGSTSTNSGTATSSAITVSGSNPSLTFWCNFKTETGSDDANYGYDKRTMTLTPGTGTAVTAKLGVTNFDTIVGACSAMGTWHQHTVALQSSWGTVKIQFKFDTVDEIDNSNPGWFVDTLAVSGSGSGNTGGGGNTGQLNTVQEWNFDAGIGGWAVTSSNASVTWAADGTPAAVVNGQAYKSAPNSLNYNNGTNFDASGATNNGSATSPAINLAGLTDGQITFQCNYQTESGATYDKRFVEVSTDEFATTALSVQLKSSGTASGLGDCAAMGTWHAHTLLVDPAWGAFKLRFRFDSVDGIANTYAGWFVDDVKVQAKGQVGGFIDDLLGDDNGDGPHRRACGGSVAGSPAPILGMTLAGFVLAVAALLTILRRLR
ncbi:MAG: hypothetical protein HYY17_05880 [Planctomycetes bacterium]|nr:hypothetical protein [Planctomycetota bacterium]